MEIIGITRNNLGTLHPIIALQNYTNLLLKKRRLPLSPTFVFGIIDRDLHFAVLHLHLSFVANTPQADLIDFHDMRLIGLTISRRADT